MKIMKLSMDDYKKIWVTSDIHGYHNMLLKLLIKMNLTKKDILIINGDSCDRGPDSYKIYETIEKLIKNGLNIVHTFGNHEDLMVNAIESGELYAWYRNGGRNSIDSYEHKIKYLQKHLKYIKQMPIAVDFGKYFIVHGGINPNKTIENQEAYEMTWIRDEFIKNPLKMTDKIIIYGHTPNLDGKIHFRGDQKISIDTGSYDTGVLGAIELKTKKIIYENADRLNIYINPHFKK